MDPKTLKAFVPLATALLTSSQISEALQQIVLLRLGVEQATIDEIYARAKSQSEARCKEIVRELLVELSKDPDALPPEDWWRHQDEE